MKTSKAASQAMLNALTALMSAGSLVIYSGAQPASVDTALAGNTVLATFVFNSPAFSAGTNASPSVGTASFVAATVSASATGTATFARAYKADGVTAVTDFSVGMAGANPDIVLNSTSVVASGNITIASLTLNEPTG
jgi:hypothetical protein